MLYPTTQNTKRDEHTYRSGYRKLCATIKSIKMGPVKSNQYFFPSKFHF